jgi:hypothetical protein
MTKTTKKGELSTPTKSMMKTKKKRICLAVALHAVVADDQRDRRTQIVLQWVA